MVCLRKSAGTSTHTTNHSSKKGHTLDIKLIKQVVDLMKRSDISEFEFEEDGFKSPMVRTFYSAPAPESPAFVKVSDKVSKESVVCIIEAMKVMNEIQAEMSGVITELLVENGEAVEYGQPLFKIKTA